MLWGENVPFIIQIVPSDAPEGISIKDGCAEMRLWEDSPERRHRCMELYWKQEAVSVFSRRFAFWAEHFREKYRLDTRKIRLAIKPMTSRWGSYSKRTGTIALSLYLSSKPSEFLEYTIVHEFCHMIYMDHSPASHALTEENLPGAMGIRKRMKENPIQ